MTCQFATDTFVDLDTKTSINKSITEFVCIDNLDPHKLSG